MGNTADAAYEKLVKLILVGDVGVGKSSLMFRYVDDIFSTSYQATIGVDFKIKTTRHNGKIVKLQIWDTAGQERFRSINSSFYRGCHAVLVVYDSTVKRSFDSVQGWLDDVRKHTQGVVPVLMIGNKTDMPERRAVSVTEATDFAKKKGLMFMETSAKDNTNVESAFTTLLDAVETRAIGVSEKDNIVGSGEAISLGAGQNSPQRSGCCGSG